MPDNTKSTNGAKNTITPRRRKNGRPILEEERLLRYPYESIGDEMDTLRISIAEYVPPFAGVDDFFSQQVDGKDNPNRLVSPLKDGKGNLTGGIEVEKGAVKKLSDLANRTGTRSNREGLKNPLHTLYLPIPQQLSDIAAVDWTDGGMNPIEAFGLAAGASILKAGEGGFVDAIQSSGAIVNSLVANAGEALQNSNVKSAIMAALSGKLVGSLGGQVTGRSIVSRATGQVFQPNLELLFNGVGLRVFPFSFTFFPRNRREGQEVMRIIRVLKRTMAPKKGNDGLFISAPDIFQLTYMKGKNPHPFLNKFKPMALTNIALNYTGANTYSTFYDGTPTQIKVDCTFKELNQIYHEDYYENDTGHFVSAGDFRDSLDFAYGDANTYRGVGY
jgi:hypothetical protein